MIVQAIYTVAHFSFHIAEEIETFVAESESLDSSCWEVNRLLNFFENHSTIHLIQSIPSERNPRVISSISIQSVSQNDDDPTFLLEVSNRSNKRLFSGLIVVKHDETMKQEAKKIMPLLEPLMVALQKPKDDIATEEAS